jgi:hypothetical protein
MTQPTFWRSLVGARKAILSGLAVLVTFVSTTLAANHGASLSLNAWLIAVGAYVATHSAVFAVSNAGQLPVGKVIGALVTNPTVTGALVSLGVHPADISPLVEPTQTLPADAAAFDLTDSSPIPDATLVAGFSDTGKHEATAPTV